ncbi:hypothetical protein FACS1894132_14310 [Clostridia bacterium]|nr:hypothetical protein FACS1894132_14310 [Clostridia bacterium]
MLNVYGVNIEKIADLTGSKYQNLQGSCSDGIYFYFAKVKNDWVELHKRKLSEPNKDVLCVAEKNNTKYRIHHANDMTYDKNNNRLIIVSYSDNDDSTTGSLVFVDPDTLIARGSVFVKDKNGNILNIVGIEIFGDNYIGIDSNFLYLLDSEFRLIEKYSRGDFSQENIKEKYNSKFGDGKFCMQGLSISDNFIYYLTPYEYRENDKTTYNNIAVRFNYSFEAVGIITFDGKSESQGIFFANNQGYLIFSNSDELYTFDVNFFRSFSKLLSDMLYEIRYLLDHGS